MSAAHQSDSVAPMTMTAVAILVAQARGLNLAELTGPTRDREIVKARHEAWRRLRTCGLAGEGRRYTNKEIASFFGTSAKAVASAVPDGTQPVPDRWAPKPSRMGASAPDAGRVNAAVAKHAAAFDTLFAQAFADGGFGALHRLIEEARTRLGKRERAKITAEGWVV